MTGFQPIDINIFEEIQIANRGRSRRGGDDDEESKVFRMRAALPVEDGEPDFTIPEEEVDAQEYLKRVRYEARILPSTVAAPLAQLSISPSQDEGEDVEEDTLPTAAMAPDAWYTHVLYTFLVLQEEMASTPTPPLPIRRHLPSLNDRDSWRRFCYGPQHVRHTTQPNSSRHATVCPQRPQSVAPLSIPLNTQPHQLPNHVQTTVSPPGMSDTERIESSRFEPLREWLFARYGRSEATEQEPRMDAVEAPTKRQRVDRGESCSEDAAIALESSGKPPEVLDEGGEGQQKEARSQLVDALQVTCKEWGLGHVDVATEVERFRAGQLHVAGDVQKLFLELLEAAPKEMNSDSGLGSKMEAGGTGLASAHVDVEALSSMQVAREPLTSAEKAREGLASGAIAEQVLTSQQTAGDALTSETVAGNRRKEHPAHAPADGQSTETEQHRVEREAQMTPAQTPERAWESVQVAAVERGATCGVQLGGVHGVTEEAPKNVKTSENPQDEPKEGAGKLEGGVLPWVQVMMQLLAEAERQGNPPAVQMDGQDSDEGEVEEGELIVEEQNGHALQTVADGTALEQNGHVGDGDTGGELLQANGHACCCLSEPNRLEQYAADVAETQAVDDYPVAGEQVSHAHLGLAGQRQQGTEMTMGEATGQGGEAAQTDVQMTSASDPAPAIPEVPDWRAPSSSGVLVPSSAVDAGDVAQTEHDPHRTVEATDVQPLQQNDGENSKASFQFQAPPPPANLATAPDPADLPHLAQEASDHVNQAEEADWKVGDPDLESLTAEPLWSFVCMLDEVTTRTLLRHLVDDVVTTIRVGYQQARWILSLAAHVQPPLDSSIQATFSELARAMRRILEGRVARGAGLDEEGRLVNVLWAVAGGAYRQETALLRLVPRD